CKPPLQGFQEPYGWAALRLPDPTNQNTGRQDQTYRQGCRPRDCSEEKAATDQNNRHQDKKNPQQGNQNVINPNKSPNRPSTSGRKNHRRCTRHWDEYRKNPQDVTGRDHLKSVNKDSCQLIC